MLRISGLSSKTIYTFRMGKHLLRTLFLVLLVLVIPLIPRADLIFTWPWFVFLVTATIVSLTAPPVPFSELKKKETDDRRSALGIMVAGVLIFGVPMWDLAFGRGVYPTVHSPWAWAGLTCIVGGLVFRYWSIRILGKYFTSFVEVQADQEIIRTGPYRFLRHPSYLGAFVMALGLSLLLQSYLGLAVCLFFFFPIYVYRITTEEKTLCKAFPQSYEAYRKETWRMFPWVY